MGNTLLPRQRGGTSDLQALPASSAAAPAGGISLGAQFLPQVLVPLSRTGRARTADRADGEEVLPGAVAGIDRCAGSRAFALRIGRNLPAYRGRVVRPARAEGAFSGDQASSAGSRPPRLRRFPEIARRRVRRTRPAALHSRSASSDAHQPFVRRRRAEQYGGSAGTSSQCRRQGLREGGIRHAGADVPGGRSTASGERRTISSPIASCSCASATTSSAPRRSTAASTDRARHGGPWIGPRRPENLRARRYRSMHKSISPKSGRAPDAAPRWIQVQAGAIRPEDLLRRSRRVALAKRLSVLYRSRALFSVRMRHWIASCERNAGFQCPPQYAQACFGRRLLLQVSPGSIGAELPDWLTDGQTRLHTSDYFFCGPPSRN